MNAAAPMFDSTDRDFLADFASPGHPAWTGVFARPRNVLLAQRPGEVPGLIRAAEAAARRGAWVVLLVSYAAAPAFDPALVARRTRSRFPLACAAVYAAPRRAGRPPTGAFAPPQWRAQWGPAAYAAKVERIRALIRAGDIYQANLTWPLTGRFQGDARAWWTQVRLNQPRAYHAFIEFGRWRILSFSPELFFERAGSRLTVRPMKGTAARGRWAEEDRQQALRLRTSEKERAENLMIVDLLRNDLGRIARPGSVRVPRLFALEAHPTLWQMTSTVTARALPGAGLWECLAALFPCGSVTGAPKVRATQILAELEAWDRTLYTGAIGLLRPGGDACFSVAIRTAVVDASTGRAVYGIGSGITYDSDPAAEYAECRLKAALLAAPPPPEPLEPLRLFETLRLRQGRYWLWPEHRRRLRESCAYFGLPWRPAAVAAELRRLRRRHPRGDWRVRLEVSPDGAVAATATPFRPVPRPPWRLGWAPAPVDPRDPLLYHKTSRRALYDAARAAAPGCDDVLFFNTRGELTESTIANLVLNLPEGLCTPPLAAGLLPGTLRARLLARARIREQSLRPTDLRRASALYLINALRGWIPALPPAGPPPYRDD